MNQQSFAVGPSADLTETRKSEDSSLHHSIDIGEFTITALLDGRTGAEAWFGPTAEMNDAEYVAVVEAANVHADIFAGSITAFLVENREQRILIDAGAGSEFSAALRAPCGQVTQGLKQLGITPKEIDAILISHLHPDHIGGLLVGRRAVFPKAQLFIDQAEVHFWTDPAMRTQAPSDMRPIFDQATKLISSQAKRLSLFDGALGQEILQGVRTIAMPGHTPGHTGFRIDSDGQSVLMIGDVIQSAAFQLDRPNSAIAFEFDAEQAVTTRKAILDGAAIDGIPLLGPHLPFPGIGQIERVTNGRMSYRFAPAA